MKVEISDVFELHGRRVALVDTSTEVVDTKDDKSLSHAAVTDIFSVVVKGLRETFVSHSVVRIVI